MNPLAKAFRAVKAALRFSSNYGRWWWAANFSGSRIDYRGEVGNPRGNAIIEVGVLA